MKAATKRKTFRETNAWFRRARHLYALKAYPFLNDRRRSTTSLNTALDDMAFKMITRGFCYRPPQFNPKEPTEGSLRHARHMIGNYVFRVWVANQGLRSTQGEWWNFCREFGWTPFHGYINRPRR